VAPQWRARRRGHVDVSTGEFRVTEMDAAEVPGALEQLGAREVLVPADLPLLAQRRGKRRAGPHRARRLGLHRRLRRPHAARSFQAAHARWLRPRQPPAAVGAAGAILHYLRDTQRAALDHLDRPTYYDRADSMVLDAVTVRNLELVEPLFAADAERAAQQPPCWRARPDATGMGGRLLRQRLLRPSLDRAEIEARLDAVANCCSRPSCAPNCASNWPAFSISSGCSPKSRWAGRAARSAGAGPLARKDSRAEALRFETAAGRALRALHERLDEVPEVANRILEAIADEPPLNVADGGTIRAGFHAELDELRDLSQNGRQYIAQIEARERQRTGIASLKVRFNNVFGYYIEISRANLHLAPPITSASRRWSTPSASPRRS
jgi:DNA mismatch repair protein MutS